MPWSGWFALSAGIKSRVLHEHDVARFERQMDILRPEEVGLSLLDAKALLRKSMVGVKGFVIYLRSLRSK
jgi:hypothetical protein